MAQHVEGGVSYHKRSTTVHCTMYTPQEDSSGVLRSLYRSLDINCHYTSMGQDCQCCIHAGQWCGIACR